MRSLAALRPFLGKDWPSRKRFGGPIFMLGFRLWALARRNLFMTVRGLMRSGGIEAMVRAKLCLAERAGRPSPHGQYPCEQLDVTAPLIELFRRCRFRLTSLQLLRCRWFGWC